MCVLTEFCFVPGITNFEKHSSFIDVFSRSDEETVDLTLQRRIRSFHWVTQGFLETTLDFASNTVSQQA